MRCVVCVCVTPIWCCCHFLEQEISLTLLQSTQLCTVAWCHLGNTNRHLVFTGEVNFQLSLSHLAVLGSLWNCGFHNLSFHETWTDFLHVSSTSQGGFSCTGLKCLSGAQESQYWFTWRQKLCLHMATVGFVCAST